MPHLSDRLVKMHPDQWGGLHCTADLAALCDKLGGSQNAEYRRAHNAHMIKQSKIQVIEC